MKVLVVEDEWLVRELIVGELLDAGFDVVEAESGEAALARYHEHNPDVLFTDIRLPGQIDGWDVAEHCRASNSDLPVVYATGYSPTEHRLVPGAVLISKPYTCARVIGVIKRVMSRSSAAPH
jgi:CheY-like chemotaxis protein